MAVYITVNVNVAEAADLCGISLLKGNCPMTTITSIDLLEGEDEHVTVKDQAGRVLPNTALTFAFDAPIGSNVTATPDPNGGFLLHAVAESAGTMTVTATRGSKSVSKPFPVTVSGDLTDISLETP